MTDGGGGRGGAGRGGAGPEPARGVVEDGLGYTDALAELEQILAELEGDAVDVDRLGERVRRAATLIRLCRGRIDAAKAEIEQVVAELDDAP